MTALAAAVAHVPACMTADELALWQAGNGVATGTKNGQRVYTGRAGSPCDDCTLGYAADMRAIGRCDGTPGGVEEDEEPVPELAAPEEEHMPDVVVEVRESHIDALLEEAARDAVEFLHLVVKGKAKLDSDGRVRMSASTALLGAYTRERQTAVRMRQLRLSEARMLPPGRSDD